MRAVLIVSDWEATCGVCHRRADLAEREHVTVLPGWSGRPATRDGCGVRWTYATLGPDTRPTSVAELRKLRPDLQWINAEASR